MSEDSASPDVANGHPSGIDTSIRRDNKYLKIYTKLYNFFDRPVTWFRETIVVPNQKHYPWYHREFRRVPTIDQCYTDDKVCMYEAEEQFRRDREVDSEILGILRKRVTNCFNTEYPDWNPHCVKLKEAYEDAAEAWFIKYGDMGFYCDAPKMLMKQKHRLLWERRHGKVGTGMKKEKGIYDVSDMEDH